MKKTTRVLGIIIAFLALIIALASCANQSAPSGTVGASAPPSQEDNRDKQIYVSFYPLYVITGNIAAGVEDVQVNCLVQPQDGCLRNYELSDWDLRTLISSYAMLMGGEGLELFNDAVISLSEQGLLVGNLLEGLELSGEPLEAGIDEEDISHFEGKNPWLWMSLPGAQQIAESASEILQQIDAENAAAYQKNLDAFDKRIDQLQEQINEKFSAYADQPVAVLHESLTYYAEDNGLVVVDIIQREPGSAFEEKDLADVVERLQKAGAQILLAERQIPAPFKNALEEAGFRLALIDTLSTHHASAALDDYESTMLKNADAFLAAIKR